MVNVGVGVTLMVSVNVAVAAVHGLLLTVMVSVTVAPEAISAALKLYVGVRVAGLDTVPVVPDVLLAVHKIVPLVEPYPDGTAYDPALVHADAE